VVERLGARKDSVDELARLARESGFEVVGTPGIFQVVAPALGFDLHASTIAAAKSRAIESGVANEEELDASSARSAPRAGAWVTTPFLVEVTLRTQPA
jgi:hypothetical protein